MVKLWSSARVLRHVHGRSCWVRANAVNDGPSGWADGLHAYTINNVGNSTMTVALVNTTGTNFTVNAMVPAGISFKACSDYVMSDSAGLETQSLFT